MNTNANETVMQAVEKASAAWAAAFNRGDAAACAAAYEPDAVMHAKPFGTYRGQAEIEAFWSKLIGDGFAEVSYVDPVIEVVDESSAVLTSHWKMNNAQGVITKELWVLQDNGEAKLREDAFEATS